jgi:hypothetical protein
MRFKTVGDAINWYAERRSNPSGDISITEACIEIISGKNVGGGQGWNPDADSFEDGLIAMCDVGKMLGKFPPFIRDMLLIWGVDGTKDAAFKHGRKVNFIFRKKSIRQQYNILNKAVDRLEAMLSESDYLGYCPAVEKGKKISAHA